MVGKADLVYMDEMTVVQILNAFVYGCWGLGLLTILISFILIPAYRHWTGWATLFGGLGLLATPHALLNLFMLLAR